MRTLARTVAANGSYRITGTTDAFHSLFQDIWRKKGKHPENMNSWNCTKKKCKHGKKVGKHPFFRKG